MNTNYSAGMFEKTAKEKREITKANKARDTKTQGKEMLTKVVFVTNIQKSKR